MKFKSKKEVNVEVKKDNVAVNGLKQLILAMRSDKNYKLQTNDFENTFTTFFTKPIYTEVYKSLKGCLELLSESLDSHSKVSRDFAETFYKEEKSFKELASFLIPKCIEELEKQEKTFNIKNVIFNLNELHLKIKTF